MPDAGPCLVFNAGSSSIKAAVFDQHLVQGLTAEASGIGQAGTLRIGDHVRQLGLPDHAAALDHLMAGLAQAGLPLSGLGVVAHRVVHGGDALTAPAAITPQARAAIADCAALAPLHNPPALAVIDHIALAAPDLPQTASFDTAFHATIPEVARRYALPDLPQTAAIKRYGFHGISYAAMVANWTRATGTPLPRRLLALHLGNGCSICAIRDGRSVATTMGYSPLEGLTMGTRSGNIDPNAVLRLVDDMGLEATHDLLNRRAGLLGLSGISSDMRRLGQSDDPRARFAIDHFCYWAARHAGSMLVAMGGFDAIAFTGGIGENDKTVRQRIVASLAFAGEKPVQVIHAEEERQIAADAWQVMEPAA